MATSGNYTYTVADNKTTITKVSTSVSGNLVVPSTLGGYPVVKIGDRAFEYCQNLSSITLPNSIVTIGDDAFRMCGYNKASFSITLGNSVKTIGDYAFADCTGLSSIILPDSVESVGFRAFNHTRIGASASGWTIVDSNTNSRALYINNHLIYVKLEDGSTNFVVGNGTKSIAGGAFYTEGNTKNLLQTLTLPKSVKVIGAGAFHDCTKLTTVKYGGTQEDKNKIIYQSSQYYADVYVPLSNNNLKNANWIVRPSINAKVVYGGILRDVSAIYTVNNSVLKNIQKISRIE